MPYFFFIAWCVWLDAFNEFVERQRKLSDQTKKLLEDAINKEQHYCITCKYSYLNDLTGSGYCKYTARKQAGVMVPKNITEFDTCKHWKKKCP